MSEFQFGMTRTPPVAQAEPEEYDPDEEELDPPLVPVKDKADLGGVLGETNVMEVLDQLDRELIELADQDHLPQQLDLVGLSPCHVFLRRPAASC